MQAFHNDPQLKRDLLAEVKKHRLADSIISGTYGDLIDGQFKACAVGCSIESLNRLRHKKFRTGDHSAYPKLVGVPEWLARLQDTIFEGLPAKRQQRWPEQFWRAIPVGANLESVKAPFLIYVLKCVLETFDHAKYPDIERAIRKVIDLYRNGGTTEEFEAAARAAEAAALAAEAAARAAAEAAAEAAAWAAWAAARAAWAAARAAWAAEAAALAAEAAALAAAEAAARAAAEAAAFEKYADKLIALMRLAGVKE